MSRTGRCSGIGRTAPLLGGDQLVGHSGPFSGAWIPETGTARLAVGFLVAGHLNDDLDPAFLGHGRGEDLPDGRRQRILVGRVRGRKG